MGRASGDSNTPHWIRNNIFDFLRAMSLKMAVENGKIWKGMPDRRGKVLTQRNFDCC